MTNLNFLKTFCLISVLIILSLLTVSCETEYDNKGYPKTVTFPAEGGTVRAKGKAPTGIFWIKNGTDTGYSIGEPTDPIISASLEWLTVTSIQEENTLVFEAKPQKENESRTLEVSGIISGTIVFEIKVIRE